MQPGPLSRRAPKRSDRRWAGSVPALNCACPPRVPALKRACLASHVPASCVTAVRPLSRTPCAAQHSTSTSYGMVLNLLCLCVYRPLA